MSINANSLIAAIEGDYAGMSHADLVLTCKMLYRGREAWRKEMEQLQERSASGLCLLAGHGRGDCEHFVRLPGLLIAGHHTDDYGKPNGWCWFCWWSYRTQRAEASAPDMAKELAQLKADKAELVAKLKQLSNGLSVSGRKFYDTENLIAKHSKAAFGENGQPLKRLRSGKGARARRLARSPQNSTQT